MNRGTYIAANGMIAQQKRLDVLAHNLANANTRGYKADHLAFRDMMLRTLADDAGYGEPIAQLSSGPDVDTGVPTTDFQPGGAEYTGNPLDLRLGGGTLAMFAVLHDGQTRYTRDGSFTLNANGDLVTKDGDAVLDSDRRPIKGLKGTPQIDGEGLIRGTNVRIGRGIGVFTKSDEGEGLYESPYTRQATAADNVPITPEELESSNVNPVLAMTEMISIQRAYELGQKMIQGQDDSTAKLAETMS